MKRQGRGDPYHREQRARAGMSVPRRGAVKWRTFFVTFCVAITVFGLVVLPQIAVGGRHYRLWLLP